MKRMIGMVVVMLCVTAAAQAEMAVYGEITYPSSTTWNLYVQEVDWNGTTTGLTASGFGIASFAIDVSGVTTAYKVIDDPGILKNPQHITKGQIGFPQGPGEASVTGGVAQAFAGQDTTVADSLVYGYGVTGGPFVPKTGWTGVWNWPAPGAPGSAEPGVWVFTGDRVENQPVSIVWGERAMANVFSAASGVEAVTVAVVPEPATLALLVLGGLAAQRRRA
jgi:hypothetical protein